MGWSTTLTLYAKQGGCQHIWDVKRRGMENLTRVLFLNWISQIFGIIGVATGKVSVAALLLGVMKDSGWKWRRYYLWVITIFLASGVAISCSLLTLLQCSPPKRLWDPRIDGRCLDQRIVSSYSTFTGCKLSSISSEARALIFAAFNTFAGASLAVIPVTVFWNLRMDKIQKMQLCIVFGLNILTSICSGIKTQYLADLSNRTDQTWATYDIFACVTVELFLIIVCGTVPTLHPLLCTIQLVASAIKKRILSKLGREGDDSPNEVQVLTIGRARVRAGKSSLVLTKDQNESEIQLNMCA